MNQIDKRKKFIVDFLYFLILFGLSWLFIRYALPNLWAFVIALIVVLLLHRPAEWIYKKMSVGRLKPILHHNTICTLLVLLFYATIGTGAVFIMIWLVAWLIGYINGIPAFITGTLSPALSEAFAEIEENMNGLEELLNINIDLNYESAIKELTSALTSMVTSISKSLISFTPSIASSVTSGIINLVICVAATAFGLIDYDNIKKWLDAQISGNRKDDTRLPAFRNFTDALKFVLTKYLFSYLLIMAITFGELSLGLGLILRQPMAFGIAAVIAVFDILPIIGSGLFLFPWAVIDMASGKIWEGIALLVLWFILSVVRNIIEPKIVGDSVGIHPVLTLVAMIVGQFVYGGVGILLVPIALAVVQELTEGKNPKRGANRANIPFYTKPQKKVISSDGVETFEEAEGDNWKIKYPEGRVESFFSGIMNTVVIFVKKLAIRLYIFFRKVGRIIVRFVKKLFRKKKKPAVSDVPEAVKPAEKKKKKKKKKTK